MKVTRLPDEEKTGFSPWHAEWKLEKYDDGNVNREPDEVIEFSGNLLMNAGINEMLDLLIGSGGTTDFDNTNGHLGVGNSTAVAVATQTDLQGTSKERKQVDALPTRAAQTLSFVATFGSAEGNFAWAEVGVFNNSVGGTMLSRKVASLGTKSAGATWVLTITLTVS